MLILPILASMAILISSNANADLSRLFPQPPSNSKLGKLTAINFPRVEINGETLQLGAGGQIRGTNNHIILPSLLTEFGPVLYWIGPTGDVQRIWLLTSEEMDQAIKEGKYTSE